MLPLMESNCGSGASLCHLPDCAGEQMSGEAPRQWQS
jgi:hypothetical protein